MKKLTLVSLSVLSLLSLQQAQASDEIIRRYQSIRSSGMGGVKITTGLYDENFFGNPARTIANPRFRLTLLDPMAEVSSSAIGNVSSLVNSNNAVGELGNTAGDNNHGRVQLNTLSVFIPAGDKKMSFAVGVLTSAQVNIDMRRSFNLEPQGIIDTGPAVSVARKFLENDALSVGMTVAATYRISGTASFMDLIRGKELDSMLQDGTSKGMNVDASVGATYILPMQPMGMQLMAGMAINNVLGGKFSASSGASEPTALARTLGFGAAARMAEWNKLTDTVFALEFSDIGNNPNGSLFRTVHIGAETHYGILAPRLGLNQGYISAGLGVDLRFVQIDFATYGEELSLNVGGLQDRRFAVKLAFQI